MLGYYNFCVIVTAVTFGIIFGMSSNLGVGVIVTMIFILMGVFFEKREKKLLKKEQDRLELLYTIKSSKDR